MKLSKKFLDGVMNAGTAAVTLAAVLVVAFRFYDARHASPPPPPARIVPNWRDYANRGPRFGAPGAALTIIEFSDFKCPYCRGASRTLATLLRKHPKDVLVVYRHFPIKKGSTAAAMAAECADRFGVFEPMHDSLFAHPEAFDVKPWSTFAQEAGVRDTVAFNACAKDRETFNTIVGDLRAGTDLGVTGTPTFLVNDRLIRGNPGLEALEGYLREAKRAKKRR